MNQRYPNNNAQADLADLHAARYARTSECENGSVLSQARLKAMTQGHGGRIRACRKYENPFDFPESHKLWIDTNPKPVIRDVDDQATFNRLHPIPFTVVIPKDKIDPHLADRLEEEFPGILAWAVEGALAWRSQGLCKPPEVEAAANEWRQENDHLARFLEDCCEIGEAFSVAGGELYRVYKLWAEKNKERIQRSQDFSTSLRQRGFARSENKRGNRYHGLKLIPHPLREDGEDGTDDDPMDGDVPF
jgi:putative DNA primase/helicase